MKTLLLIAFTLSAAPAMSAMPVPETMDEIVVTAPRHKPEPMGPFEILANNAHERLATESAGGPEWASESCTAIPCRLKDPAEPDAVIVNRNGTEESCTASGCTSTDAVREQVRQAKHAAKKRVADDPAPVVADRTPPADSPADVGIAMGRGIVSSGLGDGTAVAAATGGGGGGGTVTTDPDLKTMVWSTNDAMAVTGGLTQLVRGAANANSAGQKMAESLGTTVSADASDDGLSPCPNGTCVNRQ
jgi:hypothetical protein